jgi:VWFA-related protein
MPFGSSRSSPRRAFLLLAALAASAVSTPLATQQLPRFRSGANLVRVDAYITLNGVPVQDLQIDDFEVLEDNVPQRLESFQLIQPRGPAPVQALREPNTVAQSREMARDPEARLFVIFMDLWHVQIDGSYHAQAPIATMLRSVIGQDDLIGVMTPDMAARQVTLARRPETIEGIFRDHWHWGERGRVNSSDPEEEQLRACFGRDGITEEIIRRRREIRTLDALDDLIVHLEGIREERKFVLLLSEGWRLGRVTSLGGDVRGPSSAGVDPGGRLRLDPNRGTAGPYAFCEQERSRVAFVDLDRKFLDLMQRANRANISFYPLDPRGLVVFDSPIGPERPPPPSVDAANLRQRYEALRTIAETTDGFAILNSNATTRGIERMVQDTGAYYLLGYYSTNAKLDGRYRRLTVRVKRQGVDVRARPGYLAPTQDDMTIYAAKASAPARPARVMSALSGRALRRGPSTGLTYVESREPSYRRTERLRYEVALPAAVEVTARLLGPGGTPVNVPVSIAIRQETAGQHLLTADLTLAPLAQGDYELELTLHRDAGPEVVAYRFGLVP